MTDFKTLVDVILLASIPGMALGALAGLVSRALPFIALILGIILFIVTFFVEEMLIHYASYFLITFGVMGFLTNQMKSR